MALGARELDRAQQARERIAQRIGVADLRPEVHAESAELHVTQFADERHEPRYVITRNAEFLSLFAGLDVGVRRLDRHLGIHPDGDRGDHALSLSHVIDDDEFGLRLDVDQLHAGIERLFDFGDGLADGQQTVVAQHEVPTADAIVGSGTCSACITPC